MEVDDIDDRSCHTVEDEIDQARSLQDLEDPDLNDVGSDVFGSERSEVASDFGDFEFDEEDWENPENPSLEEMYEELREILGPDQEKELWELSMTISLRSLTVLLNVAVQGTIF
jgi:hypothetical protein